jgi:tetratricopeptide (TPR) repeat protein
VALRAGDTSRARDLVLAALAAGGESEARVRNVAGLVLDDVEHLEAAVALARRALEREAEAAALNNLALALLRRGQPDMAAEAGTRALALLDRIGDRHRRAAVHGNLADIHHALGNEEASRAHLRHAVELFAEIGIEPGHWEPAVWSLTSW